MGASDRDDLQIPNYLQHSSSTTTEAEDGGRWRCLLNTRQVLCCLGPTLWCKQAVLQSRPHCTIENGIDIWRTCFGEMAVVTQPVIITPLCAGCVQEDDHKRDPSTW